MRFRAVAFACTLGVGAIGIVAGPAGAQAATGDVTLEAAPDTVAFGDVVTLSGSVDPASAGETIEIRTDGDATVATATTGAAGNYSVTFEPRANVVLHAVSGTATSEPVPVGVRAIVDVSLGTVRLFDRAAARGTVRPIHAGATVEVRLIHAGKVVATQASTIGAAGGFIASFEIDRPGTYRVRARFADDDHLAGADVSGSRTTPLPPLREGSSGRYVRLLERRLKELNYRLVGVNGTFDFRTADAVMAFRKVQRMTRTGTVDEAVWRKLATPIVPRPVLDRLAFHVEIDQSRQVLYVVEDGVVVDIIHVSTGKASTPTRDGFFGIRYKVPGYTSKRLYYASFFDGQRAIHGWPEVPSYPASHGCVRVPYWHAKWIFGITPVGTPVKVHH